MIENRTRERYSTAYLNQLRAEVPIVDIVSQRVKLVRKGREYAGLCPFHNEKTPSFTVNADKRFFHCFGCGLSGDVIDFVIRQDGRSFREAVELLASGAGLSPASLVACQPAPPPRPRLDDEARQRQAAALSVWGDTRPAVGTVVEAYLRNRGITIQIPDTIRFHPALTYKPMGALFPAMVACLQAPSGEITGIHRTYLRPDGRGKAQVASPKMTLGTLGDGAVRLGPDASTMGIGEGIETCLSAAQLFGHPTWAALGCRLDRIEPPFSAAHLIIYRDNGEAGERAAERLRSAQGDKGRRITIKAPPGAKDWNDVLGEARRVA